LNRKTIARTLGRYVLLALMCFVRLLPLPFALALGRGLGTFTRWVSRKRYRVALKNLQIAYGDTLSEKERERIAKESFRHFGMFVIESIKFAYMSDAQIERLLDVHPDTLNTIRKGLAHGKGCLLLTGHFGSFEIQARWLVTQGHEVIALARETRDPGTTDLMTRLRERNRIQVVALGRSLKPILAGLKRNACIAIVCDQNAADVFVPFFGHPTGTVDGPARIALKTGAPILFCFCVRNDRGRYTIRIQGPYHAQPTCDEQADIARIMTEVNQRLESAIRACPEQWLWFHDRWKSSPGVKVG